LEYTKYSHSGKIATLLGLMFGCRILYDKLFSYNRDIFVQ